MLQFFNPLLLYGLLGVGLPVLAHLLSRRRYEVIHWGAMQFLELGRNTRRKLRLEQWLLMLLRMGLIALIAFALARPWAQGALFGQISSTQSRDVVFVLDGSYSMGWEGQAETPHATARQWAHRFLEDLRSGDTLTVIDARDRSRVLLDPPTSDFDHLRETLDALPPPSGTSHLADATIRGVQLLSRTSNLAREVVVLTDGQALGWHARDEALWLRVDELRKQAAIPPRIWVVDVVGEKPEKRTNFTVDRLQLSRELTVADFPLRIKTKVQYHGGDGPATRRVYFEVDGQRLAEQTQPVTLAPGGEATVEFLHRFTTPGSHLVSVVLDDDNLPGDNRADAAVVVTEAVPMLLVDGDRHVDPTKSETFFAKAALTAEANQTPWVQADVISGDQLAAQELDEYEVVLLANVRRLSELAAGKLKDFVKAGGGLIVAPGQHVEPQSYNEWLYDAGIGLLPAALDSIAEDDRPERRGKTVINRSLELPWATRFRTENGGDLTEARFIKWWTVELPPKNAPAPLSEESVRVSAPIVAARLETGEPWLVTRNYGRGGVVLITTPIDADWSTLPAKFDYVPLLHELTLFLASKRSPRNVDVGMPLSLRVDQDLDLGDYLFHGPGDTSFEPTETGDELHRTVRLDDTSLPGVYTFRRKTPQPGERPEYFVVNFDRGESDLTVLTEEEKAALAKDGRLSFVDDRGQLKQAMFSDTARTEFWHLLMLIFLGLLVGELVMTRRLVQGGKEFIEDDDEPEAESQKDLARESRESSRMETTRL